MNLGFLAEQVRLATGAATPTPAPVNPEQIGWFNRSARSSDPVAPETLPDAATPVAPEITSIPSMGDSAIWNPEYKEGAILAPLEERSGYNVFRGTDKFIEQHINPIQSGIDWTENGGTQALIRTAAEEAQLRSDAAAASTEGTTVDSVKRDIGEAFSYISQMKELPVKDTEQEKALMAMIFTQLPPEEQASFKTLSPQMQQFALGYAAAGLLQGGTITDAAAAMNAPVAIQQGEFDRQRASDTKRLEAQKQEAMFKLGRLDEQYENDLKATTDWNDMVAGLQKNLETVRGAGARADANNQTKWKIAAAKLLNDQQMQGVKDQAALARTLLNNIDDVPPEQWGEFTEALRIATNGKVLLNPQVRGFTPQERLNIEKAVTEQELRQSRKQKIMSAVKVDEARAELLAIQTEWFDDKTQAQIANLYNLMDYRDEMIRLGDDRNTIAAENSLSKAIQVSQGMVKTALDAKKVELDKASNTMYRAEQAYLESPEHKLLAALRERIAKDDLSPDSSEYKNAVAADKNSAAYKARETARAKYRKELDDYNTGNAAMNTVFGSLQNQLGLLGDENGAPDAGKVRSGLKVFGFEDGKMCAKGVDCSNFVQSYYSKVFGTKLGRTTSEQAKNGVEIKDTKDIKPGDLVFFDTPRRQGDPRPKGVGHVGIYLGNGEFAHASGGTLGKDFKSPSGYQYKIDNLNNKYWSSRFVQARRVR